MTIPFLDEIGWLNITNHLDHQLIVVNFCSLFGVGPLHVGFTPLGGDFTPFIVPFLSLLSTAFFVLYSFIVFLLFVPPSVLIRQFLLDVMPP